MPEVPSAVTSPQEPVDTTGRILIIGVGLLGGSLGLALVERGLAGEVVGIDTDEVLNAACSIQAIHRRAGELCNEAANADLIVIAAPIEAVPTILNEIAPHVRPDATVTDVSSIKSDIVRVGHSLLGDRFVGGHPMAGSEQTGITAARSDLFVNAAWVLTPVDPPDPSIAESVNKVQMLCSLIRELGALPLIMGVQEHDRAATLISHLPHLISFAYNSAVEHHPDVSTVHALAAGSYRDLTRVVASDPKLWRDVFIGNREWLLEALNAYRVRLADLESAIRTGDPETVFAAIVSAAERGQES